MLTKETLLERKASLSDAREKIIARLEQLRAEQEQTSMALVRHEGALLLLDELLGMTGEEEAGD